MARWLTRVPITRDFPPDFGPTLRAGAGAFVVETSTRTDCLPCADAWMRLSELRQSYGLRIAPIAASEAMLRSGRLGLPWVGHPVVWLRPLNDQNRTFPIAIGTDHRSNLARNIYLGMKMVTGVRPAVAVRAMAKFTGIVGTTTLRGEGR